MRRIVDRTRNRFNAAVAEVDSLDDPRRAVLGVTVVSNDSGHVNSMLDRIQSFTVGLTAAVLMDSRLELIPVGELEHSLDADLRPARAKWSDEL